MWPMVPVYLLPSLANGAWALSSIIHTLLESHQVRMEAKYAGCPNKFVTIIHLGKRGGKLFIFIEKRRVSMSMGTISAPNPFAQAAVADMVNAETHAVSPGLTPIAMQAASSPLVAELHGTANRQPKVLHHS